MDYPKADSKIIPLPKEIYIKTEHDALEFYKNARAAPNTQQTFKWVDDTKGRGKPIFFCDTSTFYGNRGERETEIMNILGPLGKFDWAPILNRLEMKKAKENSVDE
jgi:hypothetical protein